MNLYKKSLVNPYRNCFDTKKNQTRKKRKAVILKKSREQPY